VAGARWRASLPAGASAGTAPEAAAALAIGPVSGSSSSSRATVGGVLRTPGRVLGEASLDQLGQRGGHLGAAGAQRGGRLGEVRDQELVRRAPGERRLAGEQLVRGGAEGVEIGAVIGVGVGRGLLGRHVGGGAQRGAEQRERRRARAGRELRRHARRPRAGRAGRPDARGAERLGHAEVGDHRRVVRDEHVVGLDVAVHDALLVRIGERAGHLPEQPHGLAHRERSALAQPLAQRAPLDEGHREVGHARPLDRREAGGEHRDDVRVLEPRGQLDLAAEALDAEPGGQVEGEQLDHDAPDEGGLLRQEDVRHPPAAELALDGVGAAEGGLQLGGQIGHGLLGHGGERWSACARPSSRAAHPDARRGHANRSRTRAVYPGNVPGSILARCPRPTSICCRGRSTSSS
jgi:hypothetical protein